MKIEKLDKETIENVCAYCFGIIGSICCGILSYKHLPTDDLLFKIIFVIFFVVIGFVFAGAIGATYGCFLEGVWDSKIGWLIGTIIFSIFVGIVLSVFGLPIDDDYAFWCKHVIGLNLAVALVSTGILKVYAFLKPIKDRYDY